jgi:hypothetical protein
VNSSSQPHPHLVIEQALEDPETLSGKIVCDGKFCPAGSSIFECFDFLFKFFWVFNLEYPPSVAIFFKFVESQLYKIPCGKKSVPCTVKEVSALLRVA